jgi:hypothetical protein
MELNYCVISSAIKSCLENCIFRTDRKQSFDFEEIHTKQAFQPFNFVVQLNCSNPYSFFILVCPTTDCGHSNFNNFGKKTDTKLKIGEND